VPASKKNETTEPVPAPVPELTPEQKITRNIMMRKAQAILLDVGQRYTATFIGARRQEDEYEGHVVLLLEQGVMGETDHTIDAYHVFSALEYDNLNEIKPAIGSVLTIYNGGKRETNKSRATWTAYRAQVKALVDAGKNEEAEAVDVPERKFYHDNLILAGDGSDVSEEEFSWES